MLLLISQCTQYGLTVLQKSPLHEIIHGNIPKHGETWKTLASSRDILELHAAGIFTSMCPLTVSHSQLSCWLLETDGNWHAEVKQYFGCSSYFKVLAKLIMAGRAQNCCQSLFHASFSCTCFVMFRALGKAMALSHFPESAHSCFPFSKKKVSMTSGKVFL